MIINDDIFEAPTQKVYVAPVDYKDRNEFQIAAPINAEGYTTLPVKDSLRLLAQFDPSIRNQSFYLHPWQVEVNEDLSYGRTRFDGQIIKEQRPHSLQPYKFSLCAANGSGKDAFVIAPFALWFIITKIKAKVIITSSSGTQLSTQTEHYIKELGRLINEFTKATQGYEILKINKRHVYCLSSGSVIHMFATDEGEKAEGHHPTAPGAEMAIIVNEAKSITPEIFTALKRCTGYNYWLNISSPGEPRGAFYKSFQNWPNKRRVSYFDCPHLWAGDEFEEDRKDYGEYSPYFRSKWLALFTYLGGRYVISKEKLDLNIENQKRDGIPWLHKDKPIRIGIDIALSTNGDETVVSVWQGNKQLKQYVYRIKDSTILTEKVRADLLKHCPMSHPYIYGDDGGVGRSVIDILNRSGFRINRVLNNGKSTSAGFKNRGAQTWYKLARLIEESALIFADLKDDKLFEQLASRKYKETDAGLDKMTLEPKKDMISAGMLSPDRADAMGLAFTDCDVSKMLDSRDDAFKAIEIPPSREEQYQAIKYQLRRGLKEKTKVGRVFSSIQAALRS